VAAATANEVVAEAGERCSVAAGIIRTRIRQARREIEAAR
jgi:hypothetical protein